MKNNWDILLSKILVMPLSFLALFACILQTSAQECPELLSPVNSAEQVNINSTIRWEPITGVPGYILSLGTRIGGGDILNEQNVGASNNYTPPIGLPENTEVFVTITLFFFNQPNIVCETQSFTTASLNEVPECTSLKIPLDNEVDINTATNISWNSAPSATGYFLTIGTSLNGGEIQNNIDIANTLSYNPIIDFPSETTIYVTIVPYNRIGMSVGCSTSVFTTATEAIVPICSSLITPFNGETNVTLSPVLEWNDVPNAKGYRITIGTSPLESNILNNATFFKTSTVVIDFEPNRTFFVTIIPFNEAGDAIGCTQEIFSTLIGCGPYFEPLTGELLVLNPELTFPETVTICLDSDSSILSATDKADGYRWFKIDGSGNETLLSSSVNVAITALGKYALEAYNIIENAGRTFECSSTKLFEVETSTAPTIKNILVTEQGNLINYEILTAEDGSFEYTLNDENGPYQESNRFNGITYDNHTVFVRDKKGCGTVQQTVELDLKVNGFPNFFTPNGDGINDYWKFLTPVEIGANDVLVICIFDKFGTLLAQIGPNSEGWNGSFNGRALPESNYWFKALFNKNKIVKGYFSLKR
ncbi:T9SS type B sorting domain-containing protein [Maribacter sp. ACAM166]|uniref:T9SS type B sorting domain-containing protein n=1 Tax=Maribacter sp. ACAM166 TaxID=2508996 RepID=UPI0010FCE1C3|nr:T9SS type B sorting domain-containing protein [Maribacter sp. ACAM166]TLP80391.1 T9SS type B sorting domain-containing protein [Maribacter sp. ACAM166]